MTIDDPSVAHGAWFPFPVPFEVTTEPDHLVDEAPLVYLAFNEDFLPYVQGALKALARPETWKGTPEHIQAWVSEMFQLLLKEPVIPGGGGMETGMIIPFAGYTIPDGYLLCAGQAVSRETYADLFAVIGDFWGVGDGSTTFNLPNLSGRVVVGDGSCPEPDYGLFIQGMHGGETHHVLTVAEMPAHSHLDRPGSTGGALPYYVIEGWTGLYSGSGWNSGSAGLGTTHNNLQPYVVVQQIIKT